MDELVDFVKDCWIWLDPAEDFLTVMDPGDAVRTLERLNARARALLQQHLPGFVEQYEEGSR